MKLRALDRLQLQADLLFHLRYDLGKTLEEATPEDRLRALSLAVRQPLIDSLLATRERQRAAGAKRVCYLSMEFLMGRSLENNLLNLGLHEEAGEALAHAGAELDAACELEPDAALGNGGLGRLAACFLDSLATLDLPATGYGIHYQYGLFRQEIRGGQQQEQPDQWHSHASPWLVEKPDEACIVPVYGRVQHDTTSDGHYNPMWLDWKIIVGVPSDMPVAGYSGRTVNALRLFSARASGEFDMAVFNAGGYVKAVEDRIASETVSKVLYPSDAVEQGRELRLVQEYFLVACALRDVVREHLRSNPTLDNLAEKVAFQLNDTHPALAVAELMRILVDEHSMGWEKAWEIVRAATAYTNHTLLPEALEKWPVELFERVLPRHLQIVYEINRRFLEEVAARWPGDDARLRRMSVIEEGPNRQVRMAHLSIVGSHSVNGVAALHSELVKTQLVPDFHQWKPELFNNKTNGVTQRRWLLQSNPGLAALLTDAVGPGWITDLDCLRGLEKRAGDASFRAEFRAVKLANKERLAALVQETAGVTVDPAALFDVQIKRMHEYKRQLLNVLHVLHLWQGIVEDGVEPAVPRVVLFAGKAAPGYVTAKRIIHLINAVAAKVNKDPRVRGLLRVAFLPDYRVSLAERIVPAADLSEQISTAGKEASGTGNMKLSMNGALTIGTLDGANVEIRDAVGEENFFLFGLTAAEVEGRRSGYCPGDIYRSDPRVMRVLNLLVNGGLWPNDPEAFRPLFDSLVSHDEYFLLADFASYLDAQEQAGALYADPEEWSRRAILNVARMGPFSSDRTIREYAREIWGLRPV